MIETFIKKVYIITIRSGLGLITIWTIASVAITAYLGALTTVTARFVISMLFAGFVFFVLTSLRRWDEKNGVSQTASRLFRGICVLIGFVVSFLRMNEIHTEGVHLQITIVLFALFTTIKQKEE